jgi:hypothetical protein
MEEHTSRIIAACMDSSLVPKLDITDTELRENAVFPMKAEDVAARASSVRAALLRYMIDVVVGV